LKLFIDTWGWLALRDRKESRHGEVKALYLRFRARKGILYTSDYILDETVTLLFRKISFTDLTSMVVMRELGIKDIITGDEHFNGVGMGFKRVP